MFASTRLVALVIALAVFAGIDARARELPAPAVNTTHGLARKGYDPVAYFTLRRPTLGNAKYALRWMGATYHFVSAENRHRFEADAERYAPQYGGYCAFAISINHIADIDPNRWSIVNGKLYLNNDWLSHKLWSLHERGQIISGDLNWGRFPKTTGIASREIP